MKKVELLSPAKDKYTAITAVNSGCDALYIGALSFGARKKAGNSLNDIKEVVDYAHKFYVRVYVTINTILTNEELNEANELIYKLYNIGVDAIIVQDTGILKFAIDGKLPPIKLHVSTQCNNKDLEKIKFWDKLGVSRIILARELSVNNIKTICNSVDAEIETFIHGALCVSYSGQCYMSAYIGGRSANRGECAQVCRKRYSLIDDKNNIMVKDKYLLNLKDFNGSHYLHDLITAGVKSFKIEGRLKDDNYVKNVTAFYRKEIDKFALKTSSGKVFLDFEPNLRKSFNRGFTDYFLNGRKECYNFDTPKSIGEKVGIVSEVGKNWFIIKGAKLNPQDGLYFDEQGCLVNKTDGEKIYPNKMNGLRKGVAVYRNYDAEFEKKLSNSKIKRQIGINFNFMDGNLNVIDEDGNSVNMKISGDTAKNSPKMLEIFKNQLSKTGESDFYIENIEVSGDVPFMSVAKVNEIRRNILSMLMKERLRNYPKIFQKSLKYTKFSTKKLDYRANIHNNFAQNFYENCGCEICEKSFESSGCVTELMRTKHCLKFALNICKSSKKIFLVDEKGGKYPLKFDCKNCEMAVMKP